MLWRELYFFQPFLGKQLNSLLKHSFLPPQGSNQKTNWSQWSYLVLVNGYSFPCANAKLHRISLPWQQLNTLYYLVQTASLSARGSNYELSRTQKKCTSKGSKVTAPHKGFIFPHFNAFPRILNSLKNKVKHFVMLGKGFERGGGGRGVWRIFVT